VQLLTASLASGAQPASAPAPAAITWKVCRSYWKIWMKNSLWDFVCRSRLLLLKSNQ
jgi:hypothetical protein